MPRDGTYMLDEIMDCVMDRNCTRRRYPNQIWFHLVDTVAVRVAVVMDPGAYLPKSIDGYQFRLDSVETDTYTVP